MPSDVKIPHEDIEITEYDLIEKGRGFRVVARVRYARAVEVYDGMIVDLGQTANLREIARAKAISLLVNEPLAVRLGEEITSTPLTGEDLHAKP